MFLFNFGDFEMLTTPSFLPLFLHVCVPLWKCNFITCISHKIGKCLINAHVYMYEQFYTFGVILLFF